MFTDILWEWGKTMERRKQSSLDAAQKRGDIRARCVDVGHLICSRCGECRCAEVGVRSDHNGLTACTDCRVTLTAAALVWAYAEPWRISRGRRPRLTLL
jgi:hypothetical protein